MGGWPVYVGDGHCVYGMASVCMGWPVCERDGRSMYGTDSPYLPPTLPPFLPVQVPGGTGGTEWDHTPPTLLRL